MNTADIDQATRAALGAARAALYGVQFKSDSLASHVREALNATIEADRAANESPAATAADLRRAIAFNGSLREQIHFIDRPDAEIRAFLDALATSLEAVGNGASVDAAVALATGAAQADTSQQTAAF